MEQLWCNDINFVFIPKNSYEIAQGYYSHQAIVDLLRKHKSEPDQIQFIADMLDNGIEKEIILTEGDEDDHE